MQKYVCEPCGYIYDPADGDPDNGINPGTAFEDLPEDWVCPLCGMGKDVFVPEVNKYCSKTGPHWLLSLCADRFFIWIYGIPFIRFRLR